MYENENATHTVSTKSTLMSLPKYLSWKSIYCCLVAKSCPTLLQPYKLQPTRLCPWDSLSKNTGMGCHFLSQVIFLTQGLNPHLLLGRQIL